MPRSRSPLLGLLLGGLTSLPVAALFFLGQQFAGLPFVPFDLFDWLARVAPGGLIAVAIDTMVQLIRGFNLGETSDVAKLMEQALAVVLFVLAGAAMGAIIAWLIGRRGWSGRQVGMAAAAVLLAIALVGEFAQGLDGNPLVALLWTGAVLLGWGGLVGDWLESSIPGETGPAEAEPYDPGRRAFLLRVVAGSVAAAVAFSWAGKWLLDRTAESGAGRALTGQEAGGQPAAVPPAEVTPVAVRTGVAPVVGTRPELTPNDKFYRIDINLQPPVVSEASWRLEVAGLFDNPRSLTLDDLMAFPAVTQPITLSCISNPVGGDLIGTSNWTGVRLVDLMKELGLRPEATALQITAVDSFTESVSGDDLKDPRVLLVYGMNGTTLPIEHGFPLRIYIPNRYGMKQPKWIRRIEAVATEKPGYWVERGWSKEARPQIVSVIDVIAKDRPVDGRIPIGGIAWAGDRGIQKVEVRVDDGAWEEATLLNPPLGALTWVLWRYEWPSTPGRHSFRVRATDGKGVLQTSDPSPSLPDGATGYQYLEETI